MKKIAVLSFLLFSLQVSSQWVQDGNNIKYLTGNVGVGDNPLAFAKFGIWTNITSASQIPDWGWWNLYSYAYTNHTGTASELQGGFLISTNNGSGTLTISKGLQILTGNRGTGSGTVTNAYGVRRKKYRV